MKCPSLPQFEDFLSGDLAGEERRRFEEHLRSCAVCQKILERERQLDELLRGQPLLKAPPGFSRRVLERLTSVKADRTLPDWVAALSLGVALSFLGFLIGKFGISFIRTLTEDIGALIARADTSSAFKGLEGLIRSDWYLQLTGHSSLLMLNFIVAAIILCWGLWQMVKALR